MARGRTTITGHHQPVVVVFGRPRTSLLQQVVVVGEPIKVHVLNNNNNNNNLGRARLLRASFSVEERTHCRASSCSRFGLTVVPPYHPVVLVEWYRGSAVSARGAVPSADYCGLRKKERKKRAVLGVVVVEAPTQRHHPAARAPPSAQPNEGPGRQSEILAARASTRGS